MQGLWLCFIFAGYTVARLGCYVGLPEDGTTSADAFDLFDDVSKMFQAGFVLAVRRPSLCSWCKLPCATTDHNGRSQLTSMRDDTVILRRCSCVS